MKSTLCLIGGKAQAFFASMWVAMWWQLSATLVRSQRLSSLIGAVKHMLDSYTLMGPYRQVVSSSSNEFVNTMTQVAYGRAIASS